MAVIGPIYSSSAADSNTGFPLWIPKENAIGVSDSITANADLSLETTSGILLKFVIPLQPGSIVTGIQLTARASFSGAGTTPRLHGQNPFNLGGLGSPTLPPFPLGSVQFGSPTNNFGITAASLIAGHFILFWATAVGTDFSDFAALDSVSMTVTFTPPSSGNRKRAFFKRLVTRKSTRIRRG